MCLPIAALAKQCNNSLMAGLEEIVYILPYTDLAPDSTGLAYTQASNGMISTILLDSSKKFVKVGTIDRSAKFDQEGAFAENETAFYNDSITFKLLGLSTENRNFLKSIMNNKVVIMVRDMDGNYLIAGLTTPRLKCSGMSTTTGAKEGDDIGTTLTFTGTSKEPYLFVDDSIISTIVAA